MKSNSVPRRWVTPALLVVSLSLAMACSVVSLRLVFHEITYDRNVGPSSHIFRVVNEVEIRDRKRLTAYTSRSLGEVLLVCHRSAKSFETAMSFNIGIT